MPFWSLLLEQGVGDEEPVEGPDGDENCPDGDAEALHHGRVGALFPRAGLAVPAPGAKVGLPVVGMLLWGEFEEPGKNGSILLQRVGEAGAGTDEGIAVQEKPDPLLGHHVADPCVAGHEVGVDLSGESPKGEGVLEVLVQEAQFETADRSVQVPPLLVAPARERQRVRQPGNAVLEREVARTSRNVGLAEQGLGLFQLGECLVEPPLLEKVCGPFEQDVGLPCRVRILHGMVNCSGSA